MKEVIIHDIPGWKVISFGNGLSYEFINTTAKRSVFFQGDDATHFYRMVEDAEDKLDYADIFANLWGNYSYASEPFPQFIIDRFKR